MMNFLRKHQKKLFLVISVITIASFTFFGAVSKLDHGSVPDKAIGKALDGSAIMERELHAMIRFMTLGTHEILKTDLMASGLTAILAEQNFDDIKEELSEKLDKAKRYTPYIHPQVPFLSAQEMWNIYSPQLTQHLAQVKQGDVSPETFAVYCQLYLDQVDFPSEHLRNYLLYYQQLYQGITPDRELSDPRRTALFGAQSFEEWFGPRYTEILGKFIYNAAVVAEKKGYKVSTNEARINLLQTCLKTLRSYQGQQELTFADANQFLRGQLQMAGIDESQAVKTWKKVMLVHRLFTDVGQSVLIDPMSYRQFSAFADEIATVDVYQLPALLRLKDSRAEMKLHYYLDAVAPKPKNGTSDLPRNFYTPEEVEKKAPELVVSRYDLEVAKVSKEEVGSRLTLKETWDFEVSEEGWRELKAEYPILARGDEQDHFKVLDNLEPHLRLKIDKAARSLLIDRHPEWMEEAFEKATLKKINVAIRSRGALAPFDEIEETEKLRDFLQKAPLGEAAPLFSQDGETYYRIVVWNKPAAKEIMTLQEALEGDWLGQLVSDKLQAAYADVRKKDPDTFKLPNGAWKSFTDVYDQVGAIVYADRPLSLLQFMEKAKKEIEKNGEESLYLKTTGKPLVDQWLITRQTKTIKRSEATTLSKAEMFSAAAGKWSSVSLPQNGDIAFFRLVKKEAADGTVASQIGDGQRHLSTDAKRFLMHQVLEQTDEPIH